MKAPVPPGGPDRERVLSALADATRRALLEALAQKGEATATTLAPELSVSRQAIVKHLRTLKEAGLVSSRRDGREVRYRVRTAPLRITGLWLQEVADAWEARLRTIKRIAEER